MRYISALCLLLMLLMPALAADKITDDSLIDKVRIQIANDREIGGDPINVDVKSGVVELTGKVRTDKHKVKAEKVVKKVKGVKSVVNKLVVSPA